MQPSEVFGRQRGVRIAVGLSALLLVLAGCGGSGKAAAPRTTAPTTPAVTAPAASASASASVSVSASPSASATTLSGSGTAVAYAAPVDAAGHQLPGDLVGAIVAGSCESGSDVIANVSVYRCFAGNQVYDPCWAVTSPGASASTAALCMEQPWSTTVVRIKATGLVRKIGVHAADLGSPWAVELTTGQKCLAVQGTHGQFEGKTVDFTCQVDSLIGLDLLAGIDRAGPVWTMQSVSPGDSGFLAGRTVSLRTAWFAGPAPAS